MLFAFSGIIGVVFHFIARMERFLLTRIIGGLSPLMLSSTYLAICLFGGRFGNTISVFLICLNERTTIQQKEYCFFSILENGSKMFFLSSIGLAFSYLFLS